MNIEDYRAYCLSKTGATESIPFPKLPDVLVFKVGGKMFSATDINTFASISVKHFPEYIHELKAKYPSVTDPSYFSKKHWFFVLMDGTISDQRIQSWLDISYQLVFDSLTKKAQSDIIQH